MSTLFESSIVRIRTTSGKVVGAGFLVAERQVLTCAHVVASALSLRDDTPETPQAEVYLDFPLVAAAHLLTAQVILWQPPRQEGSGDIAGLEIKGELPAGVRPIRLVATEDLWGHAFRAFGFPAGHDDGIWGTGVLRARTAAGWLHIEDVKETGYRVEPGFSGGAVWDEQLDGVAGMAVAADTRANVKAAFIIPANVLVTAWPILGERAIPPCPYRGLFAFREQDAPFFFGRDDFTVRLDEAVRLKTLVALIGASGSGKSSVVFAGLIPRLRREATWLIADFRPGEHPFHALAAALLPLLEPGMSETDRLVETRKLADALSQRDVSLQQVGERVLKKNRDAKRLLLIADQFEELYTLCPDQQVRRRFINGLLEPLESRPDRREPPFTLLLTLRADFMGRALAYRPLADALQDASLNLGPMTRQELKQAIENPAAKLGVVFEAGLVERILDDVSDEPGNLPLLEFALTSLWDRQVLGKLTHAAYEALGEVEGSLARYAEEVYAGLSLAEQEQARRVFVQMVHPGVGTEDVRRLATRAELGEVNWGLTRRLADARLVVTGRDPAIEQETAEVVHEALIRDWEKLRLWMEEDRAFRVWQDRLRAALHQWEASNRDEGALLRGAPLAEAEGWLASRGTDLNQIEQAHVHASVVLRERETTDRETQRQRELEAAQKLAEAEGRRAEEQARAARALRRRAVGLTVALIAVAVLAVAAIVFARIADAQRLAFAAQSQLEEAPETALLLAYEAVSRRHDFQSEQALRDALENFTWRPTILSGHADRLVGAMFSPDGQRVLTASSDGTARLWDLQEQSQVTFAGHEGPLVSAVFSLDGQRVLTASEDGTARLWGLTGQTLATFEGYEDPVNSAVFSPDGQRVLTASKDGTARLWDLTGQTLATFEGHEDPVTSAVFSPNGQRILTASEDKTARLWDLEGQPIVIFEGHEDVVVSAVFSPDGQRVLTASDDSTARLWNLEGQLIHSFPHPEAVSMARFSPDGQRILTAAGRENTVRMWDLDGQLLVTFHGHRRPIGSIVFSPGQQYLLTASGDGTARLWDLTGRTLATFRGHTASVASAVFSPDGKRVLTASHDGTARLWNEVGPPLRTLRGHTDEVESAMFSADGQHILTASTDRTARLWDLLGRTLVIFEGHEEQMNTAVFSPDKKYVLTASEDGTARLWDPTGQPLQTFIHEAEVNSAVFSPDGQLVLTNSDDKTAKLWTIGGQQLATFEGHEDELQMAEFSPDGLSVVTASEDDTARLWDLNGKPIATFKGHEENLQTAVFSPDGQRVLTSSEDWTARLWELTGNPLVTFKGHTDEVELATFSPDGQRVLTASWDHTARLWDLTGQLLVTFKGHTNYVKWATFSPDGQFVLTASDDHTVRLWNLQGQTLAIFRGHEDWVASAVFSPDGQRVVTASRDDTSRQYLVNVDDLLAVAACRVGRGLTAEEIEQFGVGTPRFVFEGRLCPPVFSWQK